MNEINLWKAIIGESGKEYSLIEIPTPHNSLNDVTKSVPGGAYTTFRTYNNRRVIRLIKQVQRLEETANLIGNPFRIEEQLFRELLRETIARTTIEGELRFRVSVDLEDEIGTLYIALEALHTPSEDDYKYGIRVVTCDLQRQQPKAKVTGFIATADQIRATLPNGIHEALMVDAAGDILEGLSSNFFAIRNEALWTEGEVALSGITRGLVLEEAIKAGIPVNLQSVKVSDLDILDGAFITSASRDILPIYSIDGKVIASGMKSDILSELTRLFGQRILVEAEVI